MKRDVRQRIVRVVGEKDFLFQLRGDAAVVGEVDVVDGDRRGRRGQFRLVAGDEQQRKAQRRKPRGNEKEKLFLRAVFIFAPHFDERVSSISFPCLRAVSTRSTVTRIPREASFSPE